MIIVIPVHEEKAIVSPQKEYRFLCASFLQFYNSPKIQFFSWLPKHRIIWPKALTIVNGRLLANRCLI